MSDEIKSVIDNLNSTFEDFKSENAKRLDEIEKKGSADPLLVEKVDKMADDISKMSETKQAIEIQEKNLAEAQAKLDNLETVIARPNTGESKDVDIQMKAFGNWLRKGEIDEVEKKALYESDDTLGGFYAPAEYVADLIKGVTEISPIRSIARVELHQTEVLRFLKEQVNSLLRLLQKQVLDQKQQDIPQVLCK